MLVFFKENKDKITELASKIVVIIGLLLLLEEINATIYFTHF
jgi:hypothetical protein